MVIETKQGLGRGSFSEMQATHQRTLDAWKKRKHPEGLRFLDTDLSVMIPQRLLEIVADSAKVVAVRLDQEIGGGVENLYFPKLNVIIYERRAFDDEHTAQRKNDRWSDTLNNRRSAAIERGLMGEEDRILISLVADDAFRPGDGINIKSLILSRAVREQGVGNAFYENFEKILVVLGYKYMYGQNDDANVGFFLKRGRFLCTDLPREGLQKLIPARRSNATIKFLEFNLEEQILGVVKHE